MMHSIQEEVLTQVPTVLGWFGVFLWMDILVFQPLVVMGQYICQQDYLMKIPLVIYMQSNRMVHRNGAQIWRSCRVQVLLRLLQMVRYMFMEVVLKEIL